MASGDRFSWIMEKIDDPEAFEALLAHEETHLRRDDKLISDAQLSTLLPLIAAMSVTGKNVLYVLADFRSREETADDHAVRVVGRETLDRALRKLDTDGNRQRVFVAPFFALNGVHTPGTFARPASLETAFERYFGLLFGSFALVRTHPETAERRIRLRREE